MNLIKVLELIQQNKSNIKKDDYNNIIICLHKEIEKKGIILENLLKEVEKIDLIDNFDKLNLKEITFNSVDELKQYENFNLLLLKFEYLKIFIDKNYMIDFNVDPIFKNYFDQNQFTREMQFLLKLTDNISGKRNKVIIFLTIINHIFKNFNIVTNSKKLKNTFQKKIRQVLDENNTDETNDYFKFNYKDYLERCHSILQKVEF